MRGRRNEKKKERKKEFRGKGGKEKKKSSAGFEPVRLVLLVVLSVQWEGVVGRIGFTFLPSWATLFAVVQPAVSPSHAAPLCWVFCLCPRELVGPAGLCAQVLGRRCRCGPCQAIRPLISQSSSFVLGTRKRRLQLLWLGALASAAGGSSCCGFVTLSGGFVLGARSRPIEPPGLGTLGRRWRIQLPWG